MRSFSFLTKMTIFGFLLSTLPVLLIGIFSYATSSSEIQNHVNKGKLQLLVQINANVEQILTTVNHTLNQTINSTVLKKAMGNPLTVNDFMVYDNIRSELRHMQSFDTKVEDVILVNQRQNWMIKNSGLYTFDQYEHYDALNELAKANDLSNWTLNPTSWFYSEENSSNVICEYSISLIKKLPLTGLEKSGLAIANIPTCSLQALLNNDPEQQDRMMIADENYRVLIHPDQSLIGKPLSETGFDALDELDSPSGQFKTKLNQSSYSVAYYRSPFNGWIYLSFTSIASLTQESNKIGMYTLIVCLIMLVITMGLAWVGSRRMYSPIQVLLKQIDNGLPGIRKRRSNEFQVIGEQLQHLFQSKSRLEKEVHQHFGQVRTFFLIKAFQDNVKLSELPEQLQRFGYDNQLREWRTMAALTLQIDTLEGTRYEKRDMELLLFAIHNIIEEMIPAAGRLSSVTIDYTVVTLLGSTSDDSAEFNNTLYSITEQLQQNIQSYLALQVSIGMSLTFDSFSSLAIAYREGLEALKHRLKLGKGIIIQYENINSGNHYLNMNYPNHVENELIDAIKLAEKDKAKELLGQLLLPVFSAEMSPQEYQLPLARLLNNLLIVMQESGISLNQIHPANGSLFEELLDLNTVPEIEDWFWTIVIYPMVRVFRDRQEAQYHNISEKIIDLVQHYYDTDLTLEDCASRLHYNANYLSSVFRKETQISFTEYLTSYRFNMAKKWLAETDMPIKDIASRLRYNNPQNFIRSFRKQEGMTPGQYRDRKLNN
ncbi:helix-turn-helix domain-containing protein [Cohnella mopanensis]|uniref:helix-turn-helix domain-containing protein n=1 Tax=Cohnella mopanensis TaxID=2911966 RepID=UPI001EF98F91|nr:helix-turn-helix domain-containing protein [Cohnella mopanensis]